MIWQSPSKEHKMFGRWRNGFALLPTVVGTTKDESDVWVWLQRYQWRYDVQRSGVEYRLPGREDLKTVFIFTPD